MIRLELEKKYSIQGMGKNWAIAIGINQYDNLQPLNYAKRDAEAMCSYFLNEVNFQQVYYFSDNSPPIQQDYGPPLNSTPTFTTLNRFLRTRFEQPFLQTGDNLWFFFAGHGVRYEDRDYLMPIDGDPGDIDRTAIRISYVTERLRRSGADNVVLLLDACRNEGRRSGVGVGEEVPQGVITFFSCSPHEISYEIESLQQGAFTHALLQGLRLQGEGNCATVERLDQYLRHYVPQLSQRCNKPRQTPYATVEPGAKYHLILLPRQATVRDAETLKMEAFKAEANRNYELAEQFWIRVLSVSPADPDAISGIRRLVQIPTESGSGRGAPSSPSGRSSGRRSVSAANQAASSGRRPISTPPFQFPSLNLSRRRLLQLAGVGGLGAIGTGAAFLFKSVFQSSPNTSQTPQTSLSLKPSEFNVVTVNAQGEQMKPQRKQAQFFAENLGGGVKLEMVAIPGGTFTMGSPATEKEREGGEEPQHSVTVKPFLMGKYEVTQMQWRGVATMPQINRKLNLDPFNFKGDNRPVEQVSWHDAVEFCDRLSRYTQRKYRLPSEAEWEYACRAGTTTPFHFGETITTNLANYRDEYRQQTTDVGSFSPNTFGLYDMHGNVWEWCLDHWHDNYKGVPVDGSAWIVGGDSSFRLLRGGSWYDNPRDCRSANRNRLDLGSSSNVIGFRVVCDSV